MVNLSEKANELIKKAVSGKEHIKFTIGILHEDKTSFKLFDSKGEIPYVSYLYESGSIGKTFATSLLAKYIHNDQMSLDDSVAKYIPELDDDKYYPTIKRLATHTAGYPVRYPMTRGEMFKLIGRQLRGKQIKAQDYVQMDYKRMIQLTKKCKLQDRDYKWSYSNFGTSLLGYAISNVAGKNYWDLMNEYLKCDLGLESSFMGTSNPEILSGYDLKNRNVGNWSLGAEDYLTPAGNITSNASDLLKFAKMHIEENPSYLSLTHVRYDMFSKHSDMGLGWWIDYKNPNVFYHGGNTDGFASMLAFDKKKKSAVVILANVNYYKEREKLFADILENLSEVKDEIRKSND